ncbi:transposase [Bacillus wiedmannii]|uniref:transposase n=1 Tax=Bacillus wiedmannii TaxID=1890302 RepID=UPI00211D54CF|nr:transposase [Bacillus wiedmannii]
MVKKGDTFQNYSDELKIQVVKSYLNGEGSQSAIAKKYKLRSRTQLMNWARKYQETGDISDLRRQNGGFPGFSYFDGIIKQTKPVNLKRKLALFASVVNKITNNILSLV